MKKYLVLLAIMALVTLAGAGAGVLFGNETVKNEDFTIVTSFYPMYIATKNLIEGAEGITLVNLTENQGTCLHDYQLTTKDMRKLEQADVFILNGGGMEGFVEEAAKRYPDIRMIDASEGIPLLDAESGHHHSQDTHAAGEKNAHIWMNPFKYQEQLKNIADGLSQTDPENEEIYQANLAAYSGKITQLLKELALLDVSRLSDGIVSFHDAFSYLAQTLSIPVIHSVDLDQDTSLSAGETAEIIEEIEENGVQYIFTEKQLSLATAERIAEETGAKICVVDSLVGGGLDKDAYIRGMEENIKMLKQVLYDGE